MQSEFWRAGSIHHETAKIETLLYL